MECLLKGACNFHLPAGSVEAHIHPIVSNESVGTQIHTMSTGVCKHRFQE